MASLDEVQALLSQVAVELQELLPVAQELGINPAALKGITNTVSDIGKAIAAVSSANGLFTFVGSTPPIFTEWRVIQDQFQKLVGGHVTVDLSQLPQEPGRIVFTDKPEWVVAPPQQTPDAHTPIK